MSQAGILSETKGPIPPTVATQYNTDVNSPAIPAANVLNVPGGTITTSNDHGVQTDGSSGSNTLTVQLTNRILATGTTIDAATTLTLITFSLGAVPATFLMEISAVAYNRTDSLSAGYKDFGTLRTTGAVADFINVTNPSLVNEEGAMSGVVVNPGVSGNNFLFQVNGLAGKTIDWKVLVNYIMVT